MVVSLQIVDTAEEARMTCTVDAELYEGRLLITATGKAVTRLLRETIRDYAQSIGADYLATEEKYLRTKGALVHLCHHTSFRNSVDQKVQELIGTTATFLNHPGVATLYSPRQLAGLAAATDDLREELERVRERDAIARADVDAYLAITEGLRDRYIRNGYDPNGIADVYEYAQAQLISANFEAYDRTLNEK